MEDFYYTCNLIIHYCPIQILYIVGSMFVNHLGLEISLFLDFPTCWHNIFLKNIC